MKIPFFDLRNEAEQEVYNLIDQPPFRRFRSMQNRLCEGLLHGVGQAARVGARGERNPLLNDLFKALGIKQPVHHGL